MKRWILALLVMLAASTSRGDCLDPIALTTDYSEYFRVGPPEGGSSGNEVVSVSISFEPDATGAETVAVVGLQFCSRESADSCNDYDFDTDADGIGDTNLLDATSIEKSGVKGISGFTFLRVFASTNPSGTDEPEFTICRQRG